MAEDSWLSKSCFSGSLVALVGAKCKSRVGLTRVIAELNLVNAGCKIVDDGADLPTKQSFFRDIFEQSNDG